MAGLNPTENGLITVTDPGSDKPVYVCKTRQCVHCGGHFFKEPGVRVLEARWCGRCHGPVCNNPECLECVPMEQQLENIEKGRPLNWRPTIATVPRSFDA